MLHELKLFDPCVDLERYTAKYGYECRIFHRSPVFYNSLVTSLAVICGEVMVDGKPETFAYILSLDELQKHSVHLGGWKLCVFFRSYVGHCRRMRYLMRQIQEQQGEHAVPAGAD